MIAPVPVHCFSITFFQRYNVSIMKTFLQCYALVRGAKDKIGHGGNQFDVVVFYCNAAKKLAENAYTSYHVYKHHSAYFHEAVL